MANWKIIRYRRRKKKRQGRLRENALRWKRSPRVFPFDTYVICMERYVGIKIANLNLKIFFIAIFFLFIRRMYELQQHLRDICCQTTPCVFNKRRLREDDCDKGRWITIRKMKVKKSSRMRERYGGMGVWCEYSSIRYWGPIWNYFLLFWART